jgi:hypothetical protein
MAILNRISSAIMMRLVCKTWILGTLYCSHCSDWFVKHGFWVHCIAAIAATFEVIDEMKTSGNVRHLIVSFHATRTVMVDRWSDTHLVSHMKIYCILNQKLYIVLISITFTKNRYCRMQIGIKKRTLHKYNKQDR